MTAVPFVGCAGSETCDPLTGVSVEGIDGTLTELGAAGTDVTVDGSDVEATVSLFDRPCAFMFTLKRVFSFESSLLPRLNKKKMKNSSKTPIIPTVAIAQVGTPLGRWCATTTFLSTTGSTFIGRPQFGQATAVLEISCPHSGQCINDILKIPLCLLALREVNAFSVPNNV